MPAIFGADFETSVTIQSTILNLKSAIVLALLFLGRLAFGLASEFWSEDETQIYLMGLRYYATGAWPYFGPDVVWTQSQIAGALQPLLVGVPLRIVPLPEAPFVFLNVLSFGALCGLAAYIQRREPTLPRWLVWGWLLTAPWTLQFTTHVVNPSYVLPAAILFFVGFFEAVPALSIGVLPPRIAFLAMGAAIVWVMQVHMSWPLLLPFAAIALYTRGVGHARWLALGAALPGMFLVPTFLKYGLHGGSGGAATNLHVHVVSPDRLLVTLAQFFSFASLEINRFVATDNAKRLMLLAGHPWIVPLAAIVLVAGFVQPVWMLVSLFTRLRVSDPSAQQTRVSDASARQGRRAGRADWWTLRVMVAFTVILVYASYWFVKEEPQAHAFFAVAPIAFIFAASCWTRIDSPRWRRVAAVVLALNIAFHAALARIQGPEQSLYANRQVVAAAIREKQPEIFGHRRPYAIDAGPRAISDPSRPHDVKDLKVVDRTVRIARGGVAVWTVTVTNDNRRVAFRSLIYRTTYADADGGVIERREDVIKDVLQPGESKRFDVVDTIVATPFQDATFEIVSAEGLLPASGN
jgi:hypothetical protein